MIRGSFQTDDLIDEQLVERFRNDVSRQLSVALNEAQLAGETMSEKEKFAFAEEAVNEALKTYANECLNRRKTTLLAADEARYATEVLDHLFGVGRLESLLSDPSIVDIHVTGGDRTRLDLVDGTTIAGPRLAKDDAALIELVQQLGKSEGFNERQFDYASPSINLRLRDGSRLWAGAWVSARPYVSIRKHLYPRLTLKELYEQGYFDAYLYDLLSAAVPAGFTILISGAQRSGKSHFLRGLASAIPSNDIAITVETDLELGLDLHPDVYPHTLRAYEARSANVEGKGEITCAELISQFSLRSSASRIIVGEVRGFEAGAFLQAINVGASGSLATIHANSARDAFDRLAILAMTERENASYANVIRWAARAINFIVHLSPSPTRVGGYVSSVHEVTDVDEHQVFTNEIYRTDIHGKATGGAALQQNTLERLQAKGFEQKSHLERVR